jgi:hypothetical protein
VFRLVAADRRVLLQVLQLHVTRVPRYPILVRPVLQSFHPGLVFLLKLLLIAPLSGFGLPFALSAVQSVRFGPVSSRAFSFNPLSAIPPLNFALSSTLMPSSVLGVRLPSTIRAVILACSVCIRLRSAKRMKPVVAIPSPRPSRSGRLY